MTATLYPVAATAEGALHAPDGFAAREGEARLAAAGPVAFRVEPVGPVFSSHEAATAAYGAGGRSAAALAEGWGRLTPMAAETTRPGKETVQPTYADGRRWPTPSGAPAATQWRLWVSYWRTGVATERHEAPPDDAARRLRRRAESQGLPAATLNALARQPLRPVRPQQPLDIGLFEARRPEEPDLIIPDD